MISLDIYGQNSSNYWLVWIFKTLEIPLLSYYYYRARQPKLEILDKLLLISLFITFIGSWISYLLNQNAEFINFVIIIYIIEGQINLFILSKLNKDLGTNAKNDLWTISMVLTFALGFIYIIFPRFAALTQCLVLIAMIQLGLMVIYGLFKKGINIAISISIIAVILSNILSIIGVFIVPIPYDYLWIMGLVYISKILFVEGVLKTQKLIHKTL